MTPPLPCCAPDAACHLAAADPILGNLIARVGPCQILRVYRQLLPRDSGLCLTPNRAYDPNLGRWLSRDPSGEDSGLNLYTYCGNSPVDLTDRTGLCVDTNPDTSTTQTNNIIPQTTAIDRALNHNINQNTSSKDATVTNPLITHYGYPADAHQDSNSNGPIPAGNNINPLNSNSLAISKNVPVADNLTPGGPVYINEHIWEVTTIQLPQITESMRIILRISRITKF